MQFKFTNQSGKTHSFYPGDTIRFSGFPATPHNTYRIALMHVASNSTYVSGVEGETAGDGTVSGSFQIPSYAPGGIYLFTYSDGGNSGEARIVVL